MYIIRIDQWVICGTVATYKNCNFGSIFTRTLIQRRQLERNKYFCGIQIRAVIVEIREYNNKNTILKYKDLTIKQLELRYVSTLACEPSSGSAHQYWYKT